MYPSGKKNKKQKKKHSSEDELSDYRGVQVSESDDEDRTKKTKKKNFSPTQNSDDEEEVMPTTTRSKAQKNTRKLSPKKKDKNREGLIRKKTKNKNDEEEKEEYKRPYEESKEEPYENSSENFAKYDMVIDIDSLMASPKGWKIEYSEKEKMDKRFKTEQISVGIVGRENVGKTFIVNKICENNFPSGYYTRTRGLSFKYCDQKKKQLKVLLDSAGLSSAILFYDPEEFERYESKKKLKKLSENELERIRETMLNDRSMTEHFIQSFILYSCNILILVLEQLSQNDQKVIERIRNAYFGTKAIVVIHNYFKLELKEHVLELAEKEIKGAFRTKELIIPNSQKGVPYYIELCKGDNTKNIYHLILGSENKESGNFFNRDSFRYLSTIIETDMKIAPFNPFDKLNEYWNEKHRIFTNTFLEEPETPKFQEVQTEEGWLCKLMTERKIEVKPPEFNVLGSLREIEFVYHVYVCNNPKREKIYYFEIPGISKKPEMKLLKRINGDQILTMRIEKKMTAPEGFTCEQGGLKPELMTKMIKINDQFGDYKNDKDFTKVRKGILQLKFDLEEELDDDHF